MSNRPSDARPIGMRRIYQRTSPGEPWTLTPLGTEVQFQTELGDIRVGWDRGTGRIKVSVLGASEHVDAIDVRPIGSNLVTIGLTGETMNG